MKAQGLPSSKEPPAAFPRHPSLPLPSLSPLLTLSPPPTPPSPPIPSPMHTSSPFPFVRLSFSSSPSSSSSSSSSSFSSSFSAVHSSQLLSSCSHCCHCSSSSSSSSSCSLSLHSSPHSLKLPLSSPPLYHHHHYPPQQPPPPPPHYFISHTTSPPPPPMPTPSHHHHTSSHTHNIKPPPPPPPLLIHKHAFTPLPLPHTLSLWTILTFILILITYLTPTLACTTDARHCGDLHLPRGQNIHSLAWVIELAKSDNCEITQILKDFKLRQRQMEVTEGGEVEEGFYCGRETPHQLILLKELLPFENMFLVAHPFFKLFSRHQKRIREHRRRVRDVRVHHHQHRRRYATHSHHHHSSPHRTKRRNRLSPHHYFSSPYNTTYNHSLPHNITHHYYDSPHHTHSPPHRAKHQSSSPYSNLQTSPHTTTSSTPHNTKPYQSSPSHIHLSPPPPTPLERAATFLRVERCVEAYLRSHPCIAYVHQEVLKPRKKRSNLKFDDPLYVEQWHLKNPVRGQYDINVASVWESGITGRGVTVCVIDDGLEWRHPDLRNNYSPAGSYDLNADDPDPSPVKNGERNEHGTRCAGEIAAVANSVCGVGVAYQANISGIRVLGERMTDSMEAAAFVQGLAVNDIYSCSWGPDDDGRTVDGPHHLAGRALQHGVTYGRGGYGAVYVVASGNGGRNKDNCNFDGYANSVFTVTIGAVDSHGRMPYYAEECAAMLAVTPSSGSKGKDIVTTDWREISESGCTKHHSGTSAAAPLAAAVIALALEVQPCLSWRDVQHLIALTSRKIDATNPDWSPNGAGLHHSHQHGFGLMDAAAMVSSAAVWESVPFSTTYSTHPMLVGAVIPPERMQGLTVRHQVDRDTLGSYALTTLEFVQVRVTVEHQYRGSLKIILICPSGTRSTLAAPREADNSTKGLSDWALGTVRCWGEDPAGVYQLTLTQTRHQHLTGRLLSWRLVLHGSPMALQEFQDRRKLVERARRGEVIHVNRSTLCHPPELRFKPFHPLPEKWLKVLAVTSLFLLVMIAFNTLEYIFCYNDEKEKFYRRLKDVAAGRALHHRRNASGAPRRGAADVAAGGYRSVEIGVDSDSGGGGEYEILPLMNNGRACGGEGGRGGSRGGLASPSPSCDADVSSLGGDEDDSDEDNLSSHCTSDTVLPKDTDATDFTNDEFMSEVDDERHGGVGGGGGGDSGGVLLLGEEEVVVEGSVSGSGGGGMLLGGGEVEKKEEEEEEEESISEEVLRRFEVR
ncbi:uncharacterized protein LOC127000612 isoform X2 [Eriocheir sinensis]|nr:uncharacterized protein LOC127000612 isoform X2 [Eriocheir sinensis]XP_050720498.1 uncharacterized protein LOC127000612 isoform X2 [Eriocheir sinensis]